MKIKLGLLKVKSKKIYSFFVIEILKVQGKQVLLIKLNRRVIRKLRRKLKQL